MQRVAQSQSGAPKGILRFPRSVDAQTLRAQNAESAAESATSSGSSSNDDDKNTGTSLDEKTTTKKKRKMSLFERLIKIFITFIIFIIAQGFLAGCINTFFDLIPWAKIDHLFGDYGNDTGDILSVIETSDASNALHHNNLSGDGGNTGSSILSIPAMV
jgi:hypothetical protein